MNKFVAGMSMETLNLKYGTDIMGNISLFQVKQYEESNCELICRYCSTNINYIKVVISLLRTFHHIVHFGVGMSFSAKKALGTEQHRHPPFFPYL